MNTKESFQKFCSDRIRSVQSGYEVVMGERAEAKEILKAYNRWAVSMGVPRLTVPDCIKYCEETFGDSRGKYSYVNLRVFLDEDDVEEFDKEHGYEPPPPPPPVSPIQKYFDFFHTTTTALRQQITLAPDNAERYKALEKMEKLAKLQPKLLKLQAAFNLDQKAVLKRLQSQLDLEIEVYRLESTQ